MGPGPFALAGAFAVGAIVTAPLAVVGANRAHERAFDRCSATPPGSTFRPARWRVDWHLLPLGYDCVYHLRDGHVVRRPPP